MFAGGWRFAPTEPGHTVATWRYSFRCRPAFLRPVADRIGVRLLTRDIRRRIAGYAAGCADPEVLAAARAALSAGTDGTPRAADLTPRGADSAPRDAADDDAGPPSDS